MSPDQARKYIADHSDKPIRQQPAEVQDWLRAAYLVLDVDKTNAAEKRCACSHDERKAAERRARLRAELVEKVLSELPPESKPPRPPRAAPAKPDKEG